MRIHFFTILKNISKQTDLKVFLLYASFLFFHVPAVLSQNNILPVISTQNGLTSNVVTNLFQDARGFIWIATNDGLNMYDGETVKQFYISDFIPEQRGSNFSNKIDEDIDNNLLFSAKSGIVKYSWDSRKFSVVYKNDFLKYGNVFPDFFVDSKKNIWISERIRVRKFDPHFHLLKTWQLHPNSIKYLEGPSGTFIQGMDSKGFLWFNDLGLVLRINEDTGVIDTVDNKLNFPSLYALSVSGENIWLISNLSELVQCNTDLKILHTYPLNGIFLPEYTYLVDEPNDIWIAGGFGTISQINKLTGKVIVHTEVREDASMVVSSITRLYKDNSGNMWVGTNNGVKKIKLNASYFRQVSLLPEDRQFSQLSIQSISRERESIYALTSGGFIKLGQAGTPSHFYLEHNYYSAAFPFKDKWIVSSADNIRFLDFKRNKPVFSSFKMAHPAILDVKRSVAFFEDDSSDIWIGLTDDKGIVRWQPSDDTFQYYSQLSQGKNFCPLRHFKYAAVDEQKNIWFGYEKGGVSVFDRKKQEFTAPPLLISSLMEGSVVTGLLDDGHHHIWIGTNTGLIEYDETNHSYKKFSRQDGLPSNMIYGIEHDAMNNIWVGFEGALSSVNILTNKITNYSIPEGLPPEPLRYPYYDSVSDKVYFCTVNSVVYFNPATVKKIVPALHPVFTSFEVSGQEQSIVPGRKIKLPFSQNHLSFAFTAPDFYNYSEIQYSCKLDGADKNWASLGNRHIVNYNGLPPGNYLFHVRATIPGGNSFEITMPESISISKPFWMAGWFWASVFGVFCLVIFAFIYVRMRNRLEKQIMTQKLRDKIASDLHDDIGSTLSSISILSAMAEKDPARAHPYIERISNNTGIILDKMSDIVWTINPKNDKFAHVIQHMSQFAADALESKNIKVNFECDESLSKIEMSMEKRRSLYLFFKEAINNCAKYSNAGEVNIRILGSDHQINLAIEDDGKGFTPEENFKGNGMSTLKKRADELCGKREIISAPGKGTKIFLDFPV